MATVTNWIAAEDDRRKRSAEAIDARMREVFGHGDKFHCPECNRPEERRHHADCSGYPRMVADERCAKCGWLAAGEPVCDDCR